MEKETNKVGWGSTRITYEIMTDTKGQKWCVPKTIDGEACQYLRKYDPKFDSVLIDKFTPHDDL